MWKPPAARAAMDSRKLGRSMLPKFVKVFPHEYKRVLGIQAYRRKPVALRSMSAQPDAATQRGRAWVRSPAFSNTSARLPARRPVAERDQRLVRGLPGFPRRQGPDARRALHGLRRALLPYRLPAQQHHSGLERSGLSATAGATPFACCMRPTISRSSPAASARRPAKRPACWASTSLR